MAIEPDLIALQHPEDGFVGFRDRAEERTFRQLIECMDLHEYHEMMDALFDDDEDEIPLEDRDTESYESDTVFFFPMFITDDELARALELYEKVLQVDSGHFKHGSLQTQAVLEKRVKIREHGNENE